MQPTFVVIIMSNKSLDYSVAHIGGFLACRLCVCGGLRGAVLFGLKDSCSHCNEVIGMMLQLLLIKNSQGWIQMNSPR